MKKGRVTTNVRIMASDNRITAVMATSSANELELAPDDSINVVFREVDVLVMKGGSAERVSVSNQWTGRILDIKEGNVTAEIPIDVDLVTITAVIARTSCEEMDLQVGDSVTAMFREIDVVLCKGENCEKTSARNRFVGATEAVKHGTVTTELPVRRGDERVVAVVAKTTFDAMHIEVGDKVTALFSESDVLIV